MEQPTYDPRPDDFDRLLTVCGGTAAGGARTENQDSFVIADLASGLTSRPCVRTEVSVQRPGVLLVVCGGAGGRHAGKVAAHVAARAVKSELEQVGSAVVAEPARALDRALVGANYAVTREAVACGDERGMETTCTAALFDSEHLSVAQVGDSRVYLLRNAKLIRLTRDQRLPEEAEGDSHGHLPTPALGPERKVEPVSTELVLHEKDRILLCSDGLNGALSDEEIASVLRAGQDVAQTAEALIATALDAGAVDNVTVVVAECGPGT